MSLPNTHFGAERIAGMLHGSRKLLFIGVGGVSMASLAELALMDGFRVVGSDRVESPRLARLREGGAEIFLGHDAAHAEDVDAAIYTVAIGEENPEYLALLEAGKPLISRADYLGYVMTRYQTRIGIAGMNGKSTTTAMCGHILKGAGDPTVFCGAEAESLGGAACLIGRARQQLIFEACEYKDSFLDFSPTVAVILNVGMDHVDYFHSLEQIRESFRKYAELTPDDGVVIANADDENTMEALRDCHRKLVTYGLSEEAEFRATRIQSVSGCRKFIFERNHEKLCEISLRQCGEYQIYNALAAATAAYMCGVAPEIISRQIATFVGAKRRMEYKGMLNGGAVYDDYAHHPSAIEVALKGASEMGYKRVLCVYQPHTYSRTAGLFGEFASAFEAADRVYFADIYAAREINVSGVTSEKLAKAVGDRATYCGDFETIAACLKRDAREGDVILIMGAGDIDKVFKLLF